MAVVSGLRALSVVVALAASVVVAGAGAAGCQDATTSRPAIPDDTRERDAATSTDASGARQDGVVRIATFNVHRFFDPTCDSGSCKSGDFEQVVDEPTFRADAQRIATGIQRLDPDVIVLQEIENDRCLGALTSALSAAGLDFPVAELGEIGTPGSVDVAVLARRGKLLEVRKHRDTPIFRPDGSRTTFSRELLEVRLDIGGTKLVVFGAHFRSMVDDDPGRRVAEANATRDIMAATAKELPSALVVLGGDLNATPGSDAIEALELGGGLVRVAKDLTPLEQGTFVYQGKAEAIDHLFVVAGQASRFIAGSAVVETDGPGFVGSDHAALRAEFAID